MNSKMTTVGKPERNKCINKSVIDSSFPTRTIKGILLCSRNFIQQSVAKSLELSRCRRASRQLLVRIACVSTILLATTVSHKGRAAMILDGVSFCPCQIIGSWSTFSCEMIDDSNIGPSNVLLGLWCRVIETRARNSHFQGLKKASRVP